MRGSWSDILKYMNGSFEFVSRWTSQWIREAFAMNRINVRFSALTLGDTQCKGSNTPQGPNSGDFFSILLPELLANTEARSRVASTDDMALEWED